jgi:hypothetical protein
MSNGEGNIGVDHPSDRMALYPDFRRRGSMQPHPGYEDYGTYGSTPTLGGRSQ